MKETIVLNSWLHPWKVFYKKKHGIAKGGVQNKIQHQAKQTEFKSSSSLIQSQTSIICSQFVHKAKKRGYDNNEGRGGGSKQVCSPQTNADWKLISVHSSENKRAGNRCSLTPFSVLSDKTAAPTTK